MKKIYFLISLLLTFTAFTFSQNTGTDIVDYSIAGQASPTFIDAGNDSIHITMLEVIENISDRIALFTLSEGASAYVNSTEQISDITPNDYSNGPVTYTISAEDGTQRDWTVVVSHYYNQFSSFSIEGQDSSKVAGNDVMVWMPNNTDFSNLIADYTFTPFSGDVFINEIVQVSGTTVNDWSNLSMNYSLYSTLGSENECTVNIILNDALENMFYSFEIDGQESAEYDYENNTIDILMPAGTVVLNQLVANFSLMDGATVTVNDIIQSSGVSLNDWSSGSVIFDIDLGTGTTTQWIINLNIADYSGNYIVVYSIPGQADMTIYDSLNDSIHITMLEVIENISDRVASFTLSEGANAQVGAIIQESEVTENDYSNGPLIYTVTAEDGTQRDWTVVVSHYYNQFSSFSIAGQDSSGYCGADTICVWMPNNTDLSSLIADFTITGYAGEVLMDEIPQISGVTVNDWSNLSLNYIVLSDVGVEKEYTVIIHLNDALESMFYSFQVVGQESSAYDYENNTIDIMMPAGTYDLTNLVANFSLTDGVTVTVDGITQIPGETINDWTSGTVIYNIETGNRSAIQWTVNLNVELYSGNDILFYFIAGQDGLTEFDLESYTITITMNEQITDITNRTAEFTLSEGALAYVDGIEQISEVTANDFNPAPIVYVIIAEDGTTKEWQIFVNQPTNWDPNSIPELSSSNLLKVYPNPNNGIFNLSIELDDVQTFKIEVFNSNGKPVKQNNKVNNQTINFIDLSGLNTGLYFLKVITSKETFVKKINIIK